MTFAPILSAPLVIQIHVAAAVLALVTGLVVLILRKGTGLHWRIGWAFASAMAVTALSSLFIMRSGHFSAIHLLTLLTVVSLPRAILARRRGNIRAHKLGMIGLFAGLAIAGAFTLLPGRLMNQVTFGQVAAGR